MLQEKQQQRIVYELRGEERAALVGERGLAIGSREGNDLFVLGAGLAHRHARILPQGSGLAVVDLGSERGSYLNGGRLQPYEEVPLAPGDLLQVGALRMRWDAQGAPVKPARDPKPPRAMASLLETISALHRCADPRELLPAIVDQAIESAHAERGLLLVRGADGLETSVIRLRGGVTVADPGAISRSVPRTVIETGVAIRCATDDGPDDQAPRSDSMNELGLQAILCAPIRCDGEVMGAIYVDSREDNEGFDREAQLFLEAFAAQCGVLLERSGRIPAPPPIEVSHDGPGQAPAPLVRGPVMEDLLQTLSRVADSELLVLLGGETGVGKEVFARDLHAKSGRRNGPFVVVDCGAIPPTLLESVMFGHVAGSFTGAKDDAPGMVEEARGGTLFLDGIGELPLELQGKLLRFLSEKTFSPVGDKRLRKVDARIVCSTRESLADMVREGSFREDLYFRVSSFPVAIPPLRERLEEIEPLAFHFLNRALHEIGRSQIAGFTLEAREALMAYVWPGNVRELEHRVTRAVLLSKGHFVTEADLGLPTPREEDVLPLKDARKVATADFERGYITDLLRRNQGFVARAAREAGVSRQLFQRLMARHGVQRERFRPQRS